MITYYLSSAGTSTLQIWHRGDNQDSAWPSNKAMAEIYWIYCQAALHPSTLSIFSTLTSRAGIPRCCKNHGHRSGEVLWHIALDVGCWIILDPKTGRWNLGPLIHDILWHPRDMSTCLRVFDEENVGTCGTCIKYLQMSQAMVLRPATVDIVHNPLRIVNLGPQNISFIRFKWTNGPSWSTLLVIAARLSMVCSTYMYILYFLDLFSFFLTLQLRHCMHDDKRCSGILSGSYWQHCDFLHGAILTEDLLAATQLVQNSLHLYGFSPCTSIWSSSCCFGMFWHVLSWYVMVTCRDTICNSCNSCAQIPVMLWGRALVKAWLMSIGRPVTKRVSLGGGDPFAMAVLQIADPTEFAQLAAQRRLWHCDLVHSSVQWCLLSQSCCLRLCHSMWHWAS